MSLARHIAVLMATLVPDDIEALRPAERRQCCRARLRRRLSGIPWLSVSRRSIRAARSASAGVGVLSSLGSAAVLGAAAPAPIRRPCTS